MIENYLNNLFFILLLIFFLKFVDSEEKHEDNGFVFLTDEVHTHHSISYLNTDQCMLRPGQQNIGSYGLVFDRASHFLCDEFIICYPSQLSGDNVRNGLIPAVPYRLRSKQNNVTKKCEEKREEFCAENEHLNKTGQPASTTWHGILLKTEYDNGTFITTISLSISNTDFILKNVSSFNIEFGRKKDIFTHVYQTNMTKSKLVKEELYFVNDYQRRNEYLSKINTGAYLHKYVGLWALGLDILPTRAQRSLDLFVYKGCACPMHAWFKTPLTLDISLPNIKSNKTKTKLESKEETEIIKNKDCPKRFTNSTLVELGGISDEEKFVKFTLMTGYEVNSGEGYGHILLVDSNENEILVIVFDGAMIFFNPLNSTSSEPKSKILSKNIMITGALIDITIRLSKYYVWIFIGIHNAQQFYFKYWPENWWEGTFLNNSEANLKIYGDFIRVSPFNIGKLNEKDIKKMAYDYGHYVVMPLSFEVKESSFKIISFKFLCIINENAEHFYIRLLYGEREENDYIGRTVFGLEINYNENKVKTYSKLLKETLYERFSTNSTLFEKGKPFECEITVESIIEYKRQSSIVKLFVNNALQSGYSFKLALPSWINRISIGGGIQLLNYKENIIEELKMPQLAYKKEIKELKSYGTILCFEAKIPSLKEMNVEGFKIYLLHDMSDYDKRGVTVLALLFNFKFGKFPFGENAMHIQEASGALLYLTDYKDIRLSYYNPVHTNTEITVLIYAEKNYYNISINGGDYFYFHHLIPPWTVNHVAVTGFIKNVNFKSEKCAKLKENLPRFELPSNVLFVRPLEEYQIIVIIGKINQDLINNSIIIYLLNGALTRHEKYGSILFNLNISMGDLSMNSYVKEAWLLSSNRQISHNFDLKKGENIKIIFYYSKPKKIKYEIETKNNFIEGTYNETIPYISTDYVEVIGLDKIDKKDLINLKEKRK